MKMKIRKFIAPLFVCATLAIFIASTIVFFVDRGSTKQYSISYETYGNIASIDAFQDGIKAQIGCDLDDLFINNAGEIKTDSKGNVVYLNIDCELRQEDKSYNVQIKSNDKSEYKLIRTKSSGLYTSKINLKEALSAMTYYAFNSDTENLDYKFMIKDELVKNILVNSNAHKQYVVLENSISEVKSDVEGLFSRVTILLNESFEELYFQI